MNKVEEYKNFPAGSSDLIQLLVDDHLGWATSIAKSVARAWNLDYQLDGLDGGAYEGLLFCAQRYDPGMGVPFRGYARRRIHEASTEEARKSKSWQKGVGSATPEEQTAREVSARLMQVFPELRSGFVKNEEDTEGASLRNTIRQMLSSASVIAAFEQSGRENPAIALEYNEMLERLSALEPVHQEILYAIYWKDLSMRKLAEEWSLDELVIVREHKEILSYVFYMVSEGKAPRKKLKIRPGLRPIAMKMKKSKSEPPFNKFASQQSGSSAVLTGFIFLLISLSNYEQLGATW